MKRIMLSVLVLLLAAGGALAQAPVVDPGWTAFVIREASDGVTGAPIIIDNDDYVENAIEIAIVAAGQKAGLGTDLINGALVSQITGLHVDRLDDVATSGSLYGPYFNIWITDGAGRYAVIANEPSDAEWAADRWDVPDWEFLRTKVCKVYETPGAATGTSWVHVHAGKTTGLVFEDVAGLVIAPPPPAYIQDPLNLVGTGAPDELGTDIAHGFTWMFGDTATNYISGGDGFVVDGYAATADFAAQNLADGSLWGVIQDAIDAAAPGDAIRVFAGIYREQLTIDKDLTLTGAGADLTVLEAPDAVDRTPYSITTWTGSARTIDPIVGVTGATVHLAEMTIDGRDTGPDNFYGVYYQDASGSVTGCVVDNITYPAGPGAQRVVSMAFSQSAATGPFTVLIADNEVPTFQKGGILVMGPNVAFTVNGNRVSANPSPDIAGNGIQLSYGAHGTTSGNEVAGVGYTGEDWAGTGILLFECGDVAMDGDIVTGSQQAVAYDDWAYVYSAPGAVNLTVADLALSGNEWGFNTQLSAPEAAVNLVMTGCSITGTTGDAVDIWGAGTTSIYPGWSDGTLDVTITGLTLDDTGYDGIWTGDYSGSGTNTVTGFDVTGSSFTNTVGGAVANTFAETINAPANYWGDPAGPTMGLKTLGEKTLAPAVAPAGVDLPKEGWTPTVSGLTAAKTAETVTGPVDFSPWYGLPLGSAPQVIGTNDSIQDAIDLAVAGDAIAVMAGLYVAPAQIAIDKDLTIAGAGATATVVAPGFNTTVGAYLVSDALMYVDHGVTATIADLAIDGSGFTVRHAIQSRGADLTVRDCEIRDIYAGAYFGRGIVFLTGAGLVQDCVMSNIQRIGVHVRGAVEPVAPVVAIDGLAYTGKGAGDYLDYGVEFGGGGRGSVANSVITGCLGVALVDGSGSGGILATDYYGTGTSAAVTNSVLTGNTTGLIVGYADTDISQVTIHGCTIADNLEYGVTSTGPTVDALGNWWGSARGPFHATLNPLGDGNAVSDNVLFDPWVGLATAAAVPAASGPLACGNAVVLTVNLTTDDYTPDVFGFNAVLRKTDEVDVTAIASLAPFGTTTQFMYFDQGDGSYIISGTTIGSPTQPITEAGTTPLFTVTLLTAGDGPADIGFDSFTLRDPLNQPIAAHADCATILVDCTPPLPVTALTAAPGHNKIDVSWAHDLADVDHFEVWRGLWYDGTLGSSAYPEYDDLPGDVIPTRPTGYGVFPGPAGEWVRLDLGDVTGVAYGDAWDDADDRGVYCYEIFAVDAAGNGSGPATANDRATNYWLGDVYGTPVAPAPNGEVESFDMNELGYWFGLAIPLNSLGGPLDVGPTDNLSRLGIPTTDSVINFEDLMVFAMNFGVVSAAKSQAPKAGPVELAWVSYDDGSRALRLVAGDGLKGVHVTAAATVAGVTAGDLLDRQDELTFLRNLGERLDVSVAVMGVDNGFTGSGDLFVVAPGSELTAGDLAIEVRGTDNAKLEFTLGESSGTLTPRVFALFANYPNPFNPMTKISFSLPEAQPVKLTIYGVDGRRVATLLDETRGPGLHEVLWNGRDDAERSVSSGLYFYRIEAGPYSQVRKMTLMK